MEVKLPGLASSASILLHHFFETFRPYEFCTIVQSSSTISTLILATVDIIKKVEALNRPKSPSDALARRLIFAFTLMAVTLSTFGCLGSARQSAGSTSASSDRPTSTEEFRESSAIPTTSNGSSAPPPTEAALAPSSPSLSFGNVQIGTSAAQLLTLKNTGNSNLNISNISISGSGFSIGGDLSMTLTPNQSLGLDVNFLPTAAGSADGTVNIASNGVDSTMQISLSGVGVTSQKAASLVPSKDPAGIFDGMGDFDATAYVNEAAAYGTAAMIPERFGSPWTAYHGSISAPTWYQPVSNYYLNPGDAFTWWYYSLGTPCIPVDDYSFNFGQIAYVYDSSVSHSAPGVDGVATLGKGYCTWWGLPQIYWADGHGNPTATLEGALPYGAPQQPVQAVRAYGASEAAGESYMVFQDGQIAAGEGGNTAYFPYYFKPFPADFIPTAASVTNNGEFLLVTGWNTNSYHGQLAVIAIGSSRPSGTFWQYEWTETYPGFRNYSLPVFNKLLGIVDLPTMATPTAVEAVGNWVRSGSSWLPGQVMPGQFPSLSKLTGDVL